MHRVWPLLVGTCCLLLTFKAPAALTLPDLAERTKPSVVLLTVYDAGGDKIGTGTGFYVAADRIVTNDHVIGGGSRVVAKLSDGREVPVSGLLASNADKDIAILEVPPAGSPPALELGNSEAVRAGDEVVVIGSPLGLSGSLSSGIVAAIRREGIDGGPDTRGKSWGIQITAAVSPGSSGSPIMTREGKVIAVAVGLIQGGESLNFGVPIEVVRQLMDSLGADPPVRPFAAGEGSAVAQNLLVSGVFFAALLLAVWLARVIKSRRGRSSKSG